ncbi:MAG: hypothetical protein ATN36_07485 [Epulopiscium sp. Nele67-Bin005]|nr:MAG: hypothetical protein ATN36_07485 [Epulopiscium sp. Nele67-Bin005]
MEILLNNINGISTVKEIQKKMDLSDITINVEDILKIFANQGFLEGGNMIYNSEIDLTSKTMFEVNISYDVKKIQKISKIIGIILLIFLVGAIKVILSQSHLFREENLLDNFYIYQTLPCLLMVILVHEFSHILFATLFNVPVKKVKGALIWGIIPVIFIKYKNLYFISPFKRLLIILGGVIGNFIVSLYCLGIYFYSRHSILLNLFYLNLGYIFTNLYPHKASDGYFALCTLFNKHNIRISVIKSIFTSRRNLKSNILLVIYFGLIIFATVGLGIVLSDFIILIFGQYIKDYSNYVKGIIYLGLVLQLIIRFINLTRLYKKGITNEKL